MTCVRTRIREALRAEGLVHTVPWSGARDLLGRGPGPPRELGMADFLYADDDAFLILGQAGEIAARAARAATIMVDVVGGSA